MKAKLEFDLPEENEEWLIHNNAYAYFRSIFEFDNYLRNALKYNVNLSEEEWEVYDKIRTELRNILIENNISSNF